MRTTVTLDDACYARLEAERQRRGCTFREIVNESVRRGLDEIQKPAPKRQYRVRPVPGGPRPGIDLDCISRLIDQIEGPFAR